jgi:hypothetical protein
MLTAVQAAEVVADFQRAMQARIALNPSMASALARGRVEEPPVLQKPTSPSVLNATLAEALGLGTLGLVRPTGFGGQAAAATGTSPV